MKDEALRLAWEALVASQSFVAASADGKRKTGWGDQLDKADHAIAACEKALEQPEPEILGWATHHDEPMLFPTRKEAVLYCEDDEEPRPLYTSPPKREPLTQDEVVEGFCKQSHDVQLVSVFNAGVRFAETAHGIKGEA